MKNDNVALMNKEGCTFYNTHCPYCGKFLQLPDHEYYKKKDKSSWTCPNCKGKFTTEYNTTA